MHMHLQAGQVGGVPQTSCCCVFSGLGVMLELLCDGLLQDGINSELGNIGSNTLRPEALIPTVHTVYS